jgi:arsenite-transporting ATPase
VIKQYPSFLNDDAVKLLLFGGKGGVGKTTAAAATALYRIHRRPESKILIVSTDPAHSLSDSFDQPIGDKITPIGGLNLFALEMDAARRLEDFRRRHGKVLKTIAERGTYFDQEDIASFLDLSLPGMDEVMAVIEVADTVRDGVYDLVILDTAPTGHTLRLLALPQLMAEWISVLNLMMKKHRYMASVFGRYHPDETDAFLEHMSADLGRLRALLANVTSTEFVPVTIPEAMSVEETARLLESLADLHVRVRTMIVNRVVEKSACVFCQARAKGQEPYLKEMKNRFSTLSLVMVPLLPHEIRGQESLKIYIQAMLGDRRRPSPSPLSSDAYSDSDRMLDESAQRVKQRLPLGQQQLILVGGKGGVGKTTVAAATAIHLARENTGEKILLFSIDPAHSLSGSLGQKIGNRITAVAGVDGLSALEIEARELLEELKQEYLSEIRAAIEVRSPQSFEVQFDPQVMEGLFSLTPPGLDELMAILKIMDFLEEGKYDRYILDMAPTGHALRFLETPGTVQEWLIALFRLLIKYQGVARMPRTAELLRGVSKRLHKVRRLLADTERCRIIVVTIPEAMAVQETRRLLVRLGELSIAVAGLVVNMVMPPTECPLCSVVYREQQRHIRELSALSSLLVQVPLLPHEIRGVDDLMKMSMLVYGD